MANARKIGRLVHEKVPDTLRKLSVLSISLAALVLVVAFRVLGAIFVGCTYLVCFSTIYTIRAYRRREVSSMLQSTFEYYGRG